MIFRIMLECQNCEKVYEERYKGTFKPVPDGQPVTIEMDCPMVPGMEYELLLKGCFPSCLDGRPCVSDMLSLTTSGRLQAIDWLEREKGKLEKQG